MCNKLALSLRPLLGFLLPIALLISPASPAWAQAGNYCTSGQSPKFEHGFADLNARLGSIMGTATTCEYSDLNGTGDVEQKTSTGLAFWRKSTNTPTFTNGSEHWAHTPYGWLTWTGTSIDPPVAPSPSPIVLWIAR